MPQRSKGARAMPRARDRANLLQHPVAPAFAVGGARFAAHHALALEDRQREFRAADVDRQRAHVMRRQHLLRRGRAGAFLHDRDGGHAGCRSARPRRASRSPPAPAPRPPRSCRPRRRCPPDAPPARVRTHVSPPASTTSTPSSPCVTISERRGRALAQRGVIHAAEQARAGRFGLLLVGLHDHVAEQRRRARANPPAQILSG